MKRLMPSTLVNVSGTGFLQTTPNCTRADLIVLGLPNGQTINATSSQIDITVPSGTPGWAGATTIFHTGLYGHWTRGPITSEAGFSLAANSMTLTCVPQQGTAYPGLSVGLLKAAFNGLFDRATVAIYTAYMPINDPQNVSAGLETKVANYFIEKITDINRVMVEFEVQDPLYVLNQYVPSHLIQSACPWSFGDANCNVPGGVAAFTQAFTAKTGSTQTTLIPVTTFTQAAGAFTQGVVTCIAGANLNLSQTVKMHASGNLTMTTSWLLPVTAGDTFSVVAGCDKTLPTCIAKFNNKPHHGGAIAVPVPATAV